MNKAVIKTGGKQYLVAEGDTISVELLEKTDKSIKFDPLIVIGESSVKIGNPTVSGIAVNAEILEQDKQQDKVTSIRYKAKKRVHTVRGHRQRNTVLKITSIK